MDTREKILDFLRLSGPIIPVKLAKELKTNILMASAFLSELVSSGKIRVSYIKIGGSPLYYFPGHEYKLQNFSNNLSAKEKVVYDRLYKEKILVDRNLEPLTRVAVKELKDFAIPIQIENESYWKWHLISENDALSLIKNLQSQATITSTVSQQIQPSPTVIVTEQFAINTQPIQEKQAILEIDNKQIGLQPEAITLKKAIERKPKITTDYLKKAREYFEQNKIEILESKGKKSDIEYKVKVPSQIGHIICYCKTKFKKQITDSDISSAYMQSQYRGLPLLFLYSGELTKKAQEMLKEYQGIIIKKL